jgi:hypothetical protein
VEWKGSRCKEKKNSRKEGNGVEAFFFSFFLGQKGSIFRVNGLCIRVGF